VPEFQIYIECAGESCLVHHLTPEHL
jgi:hypothetical protein